MTPTTLDYHSISYGAYAQCAPFDTVRISSIRRTNKRFSVKLASYREEGVIYRSEKLASSHFTYLTHYGQRKSEQQKIAIKQRKELDVIRKMSLVNAISHTYELVLVIKHGCP
ncbi:hypothetical protein TNCV_4783961 [Trichonephila clavipes]|nr:hypothetical protein TNCV_4783961 [Trichonephila clavipes]